MRTDERIFIAELTELSLQGYRPLGVIPRFAGAMPRGKMYALLRKTREKTSRVYATEEQKKRNRQRASDRMRTRNPMHQEDVRARVSSIITEMYATGKIEKVTGPEHWSWKGQRTFNLTCRKRLYRIWTLPVMKRDGFCCRECGSKDDLQAHHKRPLRHIITSVGDRVGIRNFDLCDKDSPEYESYIQAVVQEHKLQDGITYCKSCHAKLDEQYRIRKG